MAKIDVTVEINVSGNCCLEEGASCPYLGVGTCHLFDMMLNIEGDNIKRLDECINAQVTEE